MNHALTLFILAAKLKGTAGLASPSPSAAAAQIQTIPGELTVWHGKRQMCPGWHMNHQSNASVDGSSNILHHQNDG